MNLQTARLLRQRMTAVERLLWYRLRNRRLGDYKFRRQAPIGPYIVDFTCPSHQLIIELDGGQHTAARDAKRTQFLQHKGYRILRFWNNEVLQNLEGVLTVISQQLAL